MSLFFKPKDIWPLMAMSTDVHVLVILLPSFKMTWLQNAQKSHILSDFLIIF